MLFQLLFFLFLIIFLFSLGKKISSSLFHLLFLFTGNEKVVIWILAFLFLPGTIVHELSHFLGASILRIPTGQLTIFPHADRGGDSSLWVRTGSLEIGKADPFRRSLIGLSPIVAGSVIIYFLGKIFFPNFSFIDFSFILNTKYLILNTLIGIYLLFSVSSMMFSSKKDLESLIIALPLTLLVAASLYIIGVRIFLEENLTKTITAIISRLNTYLLLANCLDYFILLLISGVLYLLQKFRR